MYDFCYEVEYVCVSVTNIGVMWIMALLVCSIYFTLVTKLCGCFSRRRLWSDRSRFLLEFIFVMITLLPGLVFSVLAYRYNETTISFDPFFTQQIITLVIPPALVLISFIGNVVLTTLR